MHETETERCERLCNNFVSYSSHFFVETAAQIDLVCN